MLSTYEKNLLALEKTNPNLSQKLKSIDSNTRYDVFQGSQAQAINILDTKTQDFLYSSPIEDIIKKQMDLLKYKEFEYLFIYGVGNGILIKELFKNQKLEQLIVIENQIELIYIMLNLVDLSDEIISNKIILLIDSEITVPIMVNLINYNKIKFYARVYTLIVQTPYYERNFSKEIESTNKIILDAFEHIIYTDGNDITDQFIGLKHTIQNLKMMLQNPTLKSLQEQKNSEVAIIVSTGPSLYKQLNTLKKYQDFVTIISVDASLPILEKHEIKPDIVTSIERVELTSEFFKKTTAKFQKDIIFASASLQHEATLKAIKGQKVLIQRPFDYNSYLGFDEYGYIGHGMSAANLAHELAINMKFKNCILIGQDLAYGKDGMSHSKGHVLGVDSDVERYKDNYIEIEAYNGEGVVKSTKIWELFKVFFEQVITATKDRITTYNCTEGGARIKGTIEKPFENTLKELLKNDLNKKEKIILKKPSKKIYEENIKKARQKITHIIEEGERLQESINKTLISVEKFAKKYENIDLKKALKITKNKHVINKLNEIENTRKELTTNEVFTKFLSDIAKPYLLHYELELTSIRVQYIKTPNENKEKALKWIFAHRYWLFSLSGIIFNIVEVCKEELDKWES
jgi:hypothetical protein